MVKDKDFEANYQSLYRSLMLLVNKDLISPVPFSLPESLPLQGLGSDFVVEKLAGLVLNDSVDLGSPMAFAHMDPPTPWITWVMNFWNASTNQNLLHPATAPVAREIEHLVLKWLSPLFGMEGGHMTPGSTIANLTALWAARECMKIKEVVASKAAHISIAKAAHLLGLDYKEVPTDSSGRVLIDQIPTDLSRSALVLTVGTTSTGSVDSLQLIGQAAWTHIDAAWGGPLRFSNRYGVILDGIEKTDSLSMSAHKWLFQPKESAVVFFREIDKVNPIISFSGNYLSAPNVGILGSHGAVAFPLLATLLAWGKEGVSARIESCMEKSFLFADFVRSHPGLELWGVPQTGVVVWRPKQKEMIASFHQKLPKESVSLTTVDHSIWFRNTAANPNLDINRFIDIVQTTLSKENN